MPGLICNPCTRSVPARGHAGRKRDGSNDLTFTYDRAERLTQVRETAGLMRELKAFVYATGNAGADLKKGKLERAIRHNYLPHPIEAAKPPTELRKPLV